MSDEPRTNVESADLSRDEMLSVLFAQMVMQQSNLAMMLLGKVPHPESGQTVRDLEGARLFIDQLEMLEAKTKGNLNPPEAALLKQSLMTLHLAFVEAVEKPEPAGQPPTPASAEAGKPQPTAATESQTQTAPAEGKEPPAPEESHKKFTKKY